MEKLNESEKGINYVLDTRRITEKITSLRLTASETECAELAKWYDIPAVLSLSVDVETHKKGDVISLQGKLNAEVTRICVVTNEPFPQKMEDSFALLFSTKPVTAQTTEEIIDMEEEPIVYLPRGQIYFKDIITEQFGLFLDPFPKNTSDFFEYRETETSSEKENPFSILKRLTK